MSYRTQERVTVKITYAGDREPEYHHWAADEFHHPEAEKARRFYNEMLDGKTLEVVKVEIYKELHAYIMTLWERWEKEPSGNGEGSD